MSPIPGTTRDAVDVPFEVETDGVRQKYILIDTAGMRKARQVLGSVTAAKAPAKRAATAPKKSKTRKR